MKTSKHELGRVHQVWLLLIHGNKVIMKIDTESEDMMPEDE